MKYYRIGIAGSGNVAWHLAQDLEKVGHIIPVIYSRNLDNAELLANQLYDTQAINEPDFSAFALDLLFICLRDDAIESLLDQLLVSEETVVAHTSGFKSLEALQPLGSSIGVFYPLQSFTKTRPVDFQAIPIFLEYDNAPTQEILSRVARSLSSQVHELNSERRRFLHLAAVFTNNFCNHMLFWAQTIAESEGIEFQWFKSLAKETVEKAFSLGPELAQTGPALRNDAQTLSVQEKMLQDNPELLQLFRLLNQSIQRNN